MKHSERTHWSGMATRQAHCVPAGAAVHLKDFPTKSKPLFKSHKQYKHLLAADAADLSALQRVLYASNTYSLLLIFQAMDSAGKDGAIGHVLTGVDPQGCEVYSFKHPSAIELEHDFLWRTTRCLPARGRIGVFNRSSYEEVLITRVHPAILEGEHIPDEHRSKKHFWRGRYRSIVELERHLHHSGTRVIKFYLHLSKEEQRKRFLARIDDPDKSWKLSPADITERGFWKKYMKAYEECLSATSTDLAPWHVVPADDKDNARLIVSGVVIDVLKGLKMSYPKLTRARRHALRNIRKQLEKQ